MAEGAVPDINEARLPHLPHSGCCRAVSSVAVSHSAWDAAVEGSKLARVHVGRKPLVAAAAGVPEPRGLVMPDSPDLRPFCFERFQREGKS